MHLDFLHDIVTHYFALCCQFFLETKVFLFWSPGGFNFGSSPVVSLAVSLEVYLPHQIIVGEAFLGSSKSDFQ